MKFHRTIAGFVCGVLVAAVMGACAQKTDGSFSPAQVEQIQNIVHTYLVAHPEVLIEASQALQQQELTKAEVAAKIAISQNAALLFNSKTTPVGGNVNGTVTIVEFFDYQCPHCINMAGILNSLIQNNSNVRVVSMEFPIFGDVSDYAARAALAAGLQGKYWQMHNGLFGAGKRLTHDVIDQIAQQVGVNVAQMKKDMSDASITTELMTVRMLAQNLQLQGTPAFIVAPSSFKQGDSEAKVSFFPGQMSQDQLQQFIGKAE